MPMPFAGLPRDVRPECPHSRPQAMDSRSSPLLSEKRQVRGVRKLPRLREQESGQALFLGYRLEPRHNFSEAE
jgi:hypothetical protein